MQSFEIAEDIEQILKWFAQNARQLPWREERTPYRIWVSEIMLQQTRVEAVKGYFERFMKALPTVADLAEVPEDELLKLWEGLGYYNRVRNMQKAARVVCEQYHGELPMDFEALLKLPGIGSYTAGAIASQAFSIPEPAVDGNVLRVLARLDGDERDIADVTVKGKVEDRLRNVMRNQLPKGQAGNFNQALMELGATICVPNGAPKCESCPMQARCVAYVENRQDFLPVKSPKKPRTIEEKTILLISDDRQVLIHKRKQTGLLAGMYEFPNLEGHLGEKEALDHVADLGLMSLRIEPLPDSKHIFTHREWLMKAYRISVADEVDTEQIPQDLIFVNRTQIEEKYPLPSAFSRYTKYVKTCYNI